MKRDKDTKNILFCSAVSPELELGASRVVVELAEAMREIGWRCDVIGPRDKAFRWRKGAGQQAGYAEGLHAYLKTHAGRYDVVEYPHNRLPYRRTDFASNTLFVARSVLLRHHFWPSPFPITWRRRAGIYLRGRTPSGEAEKGVERANATIGEADLVNVSNFHDRTVLVDAGVPPEKIVVLPFGMSRNRRKVFDLCRAGVAGTPVVVFIGRFDRRKGAKDLPLIAARISRKIPEARFRILGTGLSRKTVLACFPARLAGRVEVVERYASADLPALLDGCSVGILSSYVEGFPFAVLEMLSASIPVIAYDAPGAPMMLEERYLVPCGDTAGMAEKIAGLLSSSVDLAEAALRAGEVSRRFRWEDIAVETADIYTRRTAALMKGQPA